MWLNRPYRRCFCAFCRKPRKVYVKRHLSWTDVGSSIVLTAVSTAVIWKTVSPKGILVLIAFLILAEIIVQMRWRVSLPCPQCGFDPLLYKRSPELASKQVRRFYEQRRERADFLLTGQALIETQKRIHEAQRERSPKDVRLSWSAPPANVVPASGPRPSGKGLSRTV